MRNEIAQLFVLMILLTSATKAQQNSLPFSAAKSFLEPPDTASFEFSSGGHQYRISGNGQGHRSANNKRYFSLRVAPNDYLTHNLYYAEYEDDLLLIGEVSNGDYGMGFIARLDGATLRMQWRRVIPGFDVGQGLLDGAFAYVTGIGFVGKVNLQSGAHAWRHTDLYGQANSAFNAFALPEVEGNVVVFRQSEHYLRKKAAVIRVQRHTGKIISVIT